MLNVLRHHKRIEERIELSDNFLLSAKIIKDCFASIGEHIFSSLIAIFNKIKVEEVSNKQSIIRLTLLVIDTVGKDVFNYTLYCFQKGLWTSTKTHNLGFMESTFNKADKFPNGKWILQQGFQEVR